MNRNETHIRDRQTCDVSAIRPLPMAWRPKMAVLLVLLATLVFGAQSGAAADAATVSVRSNAQSSFPDTLNLVLIAALILMGILLLRRAIPVIMEYLNPQLQALGFVSPPTPEAWPKTLAEEEDVSKFLGGLRPDPAAGPSSAKAAVAPASRPVIERAAANLSDPLKEFFGWAPAHITDLRHLFTKVERAARESGGKPATREKLSDLAIEIRRLKTKVGLPELLPVLQMASALEGLLKQLTDRLDALNQSTLRTISGGIDLLAELCVPELRVDIATNPPIQILSVDDDPVSRFALSSSVKKVFTPPALAENGVAALDLVSKQAFDLIFLDVSMPGMDGFEVCSRIHEKDLNRSTPVVFVTSLKDFESQATALVSGGSDLIGKPFLTFEIAVKALTLVLHARLKKRDRIIEDSNATGSGSPASVPPADAGPVAAPLPWQQPSEPLQAKAVTSANPALSTEALAEASASLAAMRNELRELGQTLDDAVRREKLLTLHLRSQSLARQLDRPELRPAFQLCSSLQGFLKKLQEKPVNAGASTLDTATAAVDVLHDLCLQNVKPDLADSPAISILVVDDEPLSRRAVVGAVQTAFLKPASAENGETAMTLAMEKTFDVIFLDVEMPGMDGFQVCAKIRETGLNRATPVVFVTSHKDFKSRAQSTRSGGNDFVVKPFLFVEITLKALTFALRNRLQKLGRQSNTP